MQLPSIKNPVRFKDQNITVVIYAYKELTAAEKRRTALLFCATHKVKPNKVYKAFYLKR